jgi:hypothetical protein
MLAKHQPTTANGAELFGDIVHMNDPDSIIDDGDSVVLPSLAGLRLIELDPSAPPARRRAPRRFIIAPVLLEQRRGDRRRTKPGIDGLLRVVLADDWAL